MNNLIIALISVAFAAALSLAGVNYVSRGADISQTQAVNNTTQIEGLITDYQTLKSNLGRRPVSTDYAVQFPVSSTATGVIQSQNLAYSVSGGSVTSTSSMDNAPGKWTYMPGCNGGTQDCFSMYVTNSNPAIYKAAKLSAMQELSGPTASRIELGTAADSAATAITDPHGWPSTPPSSYYLTVRLNSQTVAAASVSTNYSYTATPQWSITPGCGQTTETLVGWTCTQYPGNTTVANSVCIANSVQPPATQTTTDMTHCLAYSSRQTSPGSCSGGVQTCTWNCYDSNGAQATPDHCSPPAGCTQSCAATSGTGGSNSSTSSSGSSSTGSGGSSSGSTGSNTATTTPSAPAVAYTYAVSNIVYGTCSAACGDSTQPATSWTCTRSDGTQVASALCGTPAGFACTSYSSCSAQNTTYGSCSNQCGTGTATLSSWTCGDGNGNNVAQSHCTAPASTQSCTSTAGCLYTFTNPTYLTCTPACGTSTAPINPVNPGTCTRSDGTVVLPVFCSGQIPGSTACTNYSLCAAVGAYSNCSNTCGVGTQTLTGSSCRDSSGNTLPASACPALPTTRACVGTSSCFYTALFPTYGSCSNTCGSGVTPVTRFYCYRSDGTLVDPSYCTPPAAPSCTQYTSCSVANATYGACSNSCGTGTQTLNPSWSCVDGSGNSVGQSRCTPPPSSMACTGTSSCTYATANVTYGACQPACGASTQPVSFTCRRSDGTTVANSYCNAPTAPSCTSYSLCTANSTYGPCSSSCGTGTQTLQSYTCTNTNGVAVPQSECATPASSQSCSSASGCVYHTVPVYGSCAAGCGSSTQTLSSYTCQTQNGTVVANSYCTPPASSIACTDNTQCSSITYQAIPDSQGSCMPANCGVYSTNQVLTWHCEKYLSGADQGPVSNSYCSAPVGSTCVYTANCYSYTSANPVYSACSPTCGPAGTTGTKTLQSYQCYRDDPVAGSVLVTDVTDTPNCSPASLGLATTQSCTPPTCH